MENWIKKLLFDMPKIELHLHLDGAILPKTALDLSGSGLSFSEAYHKLVVNKHLTSQKELLAYFDYPVSLLQTKEALSRVTKELFHQKAAENVRYMEIRWAPQLHTLKGLTIRQVAEAVLDASKSAGTKTGVLWKLIIVGLRNEPIAHNLELLEAVCDMREDIVAVDYAGVEADNPDPCMQLEFFKRARELGFLITLHCGELPCSAPMLHRVLKKIKPGRIAHGAGAVTDEVLCEILREQDIQLDLCPCSNIQAGLYPNYLSYPLGELFHRGVPVSLSTDSPTLSGLSLSCEYGKIVESGILTVDELWRINFDSITRSFASDSQKQKLMEIFSEWSRNIPELKLKG